MTAKGRRKPKVPASRRMSQVRRCGRCYGKVVHKYDENGAFVGKFDPADQSVRHECDY